MKVWTLELMKAGHLDDVLLTGSGRVRATRRAGRVAVTVDAQVPAGTAPGTLTVLACADDPSRVRERNERNNCESTRRL